MILFSALKRFLPFGALAIIVSLSTIIPSVSAHGTTYPLTIENCGRSLTFDKAPERVVTTWQATAELLVKLGLGDKIIGTVWNNQFPAFPEIADEFNALPILSKEGASKEILLTANPDFIFSAGLSWDFDPSSGAASLEEVESAGIKVFGLSDNCTAESHVTYEDMYDDILKIGTIFDVQHEAEHLVKDMKNRVETVQKKVQGLAPVKVFFDAGGEGPIGTAGAGLQDDQIRLAGGENIFSDHINYFESVSLEEVAARQPEIFVVDTWDDPTYIQGRSQWLFTTFSETPAGKNKRFIEIPGIYIYYGSIRFADGIEMMAKAFHPEAFADEPVATLEAVPQDHLAALATTEPVENIPDNAILLPILDDLPSAEPDLSTFPVTVENCGRSLTFDAPPSRIISLWQPPTEILFALGQGDRFAALAGSYAPYPYIYAAQVGRIPAIGFAMMWPSREVLLSQNPDFVISEGLDSFGYDPAQGYATVEEIEATGAKVFSTAACFFSDSSAPVRTIDDIFADIRTLGTIFGVSTRAEALIARMEEQRQHVVEHISGADPVRVVFYNGGEGPLYVLNVSVWADLLVTAGGDNVFANHTNEVSAEEFAAADPDVILVGYFPGEAPEGRIEYLKKTFPSLKAVQNNRIVAIPTINTENSIRIMYGLEQIAQALHPEAFK